MDIEVIDNFLDKESFKNIQTILLNTKFPWFLNQVLDDDLSNTQKYNFQFIHFFYDGINPSIFFEELQPIIKKIDPLEIKYIKSNLLIRTHEIIKHGFHVDIPSSPPNYRTSIFYVNNCDGYTEFEDGTKVFSKENRFITFPTKMKHTGTTCTNNHIRLVINFNYTIKG